MRLSNDFVTINGEKILKVNTICEYSSDCKDQDGVQSCNQHT